MKQSEEALNSIKFAFRHGQFDQAAVSLERLRAESGLSPGQLSQLGYAYTMLQQLREGEKCFREAAEVAPGPQTWSNLGNILRLRGKYEEAAEIINRALEKEPSNTDAQTNLALIYRQLRRHREAIEILHSLPAMSVETLLELSINYRIVGQAENALSCQQSAYHMAPEDPKVLLQLAICLEMTGSRDSAISHLKYAASIDPENIEVLSQLAHLMELTGDVDNCAQICQKFSPLESSNTLAQHVRARLKFREKDYAGTIEILDQMEVPESDSQLQQQRFTLYGKCFDKLGEYERAWQSFTQANLISQSDSGNPGLMNAFYRQLKLLGKAPADAERKQAVVAGQNGLHACGDSPVFIVGLPRSGTTLLGYLLGSLPGVMVLDEERLFFNSVLKVLGTNDAEKLLTISEQQSAEIAENYRSLSKEKNYSENRILIDKDPLNLVNVEVIGKVFPRARFLYISRHPYDVALSLYMQNFAERSVLSQCNTIQHCVRFCGEILSTWDQIESRALVNIFKLSYEDFVADPDSHIKRISAWMGEAPADQAIEPEQDILSRIRTPSYVQVTEPVNRSGVCRWKHYSQFLTEEVMEPLKKWTRTYDLNHSGK
jgi:tetratricopeptide (TPR) repeat protein